MDEDRPTPPLRVASVRDGKNGPTSTEKEKKKVWPFGGKKNQGKWWEVVSADS